MTEIVFVRHGQTAWSGQRYCGRSDPSLNRPGRAAATQTAANLRARLPPGSRIISSPRRRAVQTATIVSVALGDEPLEIDERWAETDFGMVEGLTFDELLTTSPDIAARLVAGEVDIDWPDGEPAATLAARIAAAWRDVAMGRTGTIVVVTHGGPIRIAVALATGRPTTRVTVPVPGGFVHLTRPERGDSWSVVETP